MAKVNTDVSGKPLPCELYLDGYLKSNIETLHERVIKKWDSVGLITGYSGDGKTELGKQIALYLDHTFCLDRIVFTPQQFEKAIDKASVGQAILWDEADDISSNWNSEIITVLKSKFRRIRKKRLHIILITPSFFDINKYFVCDRILYLIHVYAKNLERGYLSFFGRTKIKDLYMQGGKYWNMQAVLPNFKARYTKLPAAYPVDVEAYEQKKDEATRDMLKNNKSKSQLIMEYRRDSLMRLHKLCEKKDVSFTYEEYAKVFGLKKSSIGNDFKILLEEGKA